jgi:hypothetical protein
MTYELITWFSTRPLDTRLNAGAAASGLPELLTVEEAARLIRVGRTKAYAMTREWRATNGRSGLPVVDFGNVLRVPRRALEELIGVELFGNAIVPPTSQAPEIALPSPVATLPRARRSRPQRDAITQPDLFTAMPAIP